MFTVNIDPKPNLNPNLKTAFFKQKRPRPRVLLTPFFSGLLYRITWVLRCLHKLNAIIFHLLKLNLRDQKYEIFTYCIYSIWGKIARQFGEYGVITFMAKTFLFSVGVCYLLVDIHHVSDLCFRPKAPWSSARIEIRTNSENNLDSENVPQIKKFSNAISFLEGFQIRRVVSQRETLSAEKNCVLRLLVMLHIWKHSVIGCPCCI